MAIHRCDITEVTTDELGSSYVLYLLSDEFQLLIHNYISIILHFAECQILEMMIGLSEVSRMENTITTRGLVSVRIGAEFGKSLILENPYLS